MCVNCHRIGHLLTPWLVQAVRKTAAARERLGWSPSKSRSAAQEAVGSKAAEQHQAAEKAANLEQAATNGEQPARRVPQQEAVDAAEAAGALAAQNEAAEKALVQAAAVLNDEIGGMTVDDFEASMVRIQQHEALSTPTKLSEPQPPVANSPLVNCVRSYLSASRVNCTDVATSTPSPLQQSADEPDSNLDTAFESKQSLLQAYSGLGLNAEGQALLADIEDAPNAFCDDKRPLVRAVAHDVLAATIQSSEAEYVGVKQLQAQHAAEIKRIQSAHTTQVESLEAQVGQLAAEMAAVKDLLGAIVSSPQFSRGADDQAPTLPLMVHAAGSARQLTVQYLLEAGHATAARSKHARVPASYRMCQPDTPDCIERLSRPCGHTSGPFTNKPRLVKDCSHCRPEMYHLLAEVLKQESPPLPVLVEDTQCSPLIAACSKGDLEMVSLLVICGGADVSEIVEGQQALQVATAGGRFDIAQLLIEAGAEVSTESAHYSTISGHGYDHRQLVEYLQGHGARDVNVVYHP